MNLQMLVLLGVFLITFALVFVGGSLVIRNAYIRFFWMVGKPFKKGDFVEVCGIEGRIIKMGWQAVSLETVVGDKVLISNVQIWQSSIVKTQSLSGSHGVEIRLPLQPDSDGAISRQAAVESLLLSPYLALDRPYDVGLEVLPSGEVVVRVRASVFYVGHKELFETSIIENYQL